MDTKLVGALTALVAAVLLTLAPCAAGAGDPSVAASQVALRAEGLYDGPIDGINGPATVAALRSLQSAHGLSPDGVLGNRTAALLGKYAPRRLGSRILKLTESGWDVAELQFALAWHGFPSGVFDGRFGVHVAGALRRFQQFADLAPDGIAGPETVAALGLPLPHSPISLRWPLQEPVTDGFGPRGNRFHAGVDLPAPAGTPVEAAADGRVTWVGFRVGWGLVVTLAHRDSVRTMYAHLSASSVHLGELVEPGSTVGLVGATGDATGPHLHFEVRLRGAAVDPLPALH